jgi:hypothetical protein
MTAVFAVTSSLDLPRIEGIVMVMVWMWLWNDFGMVMIMVWYWIEMILVYL